MVIASPVADDPKWDQKRVSRSEAMNLPRFVGQGDRSFKGICSTPINFASMNGRPVF